MIILQNRAVIVDLPFPCVSPFAVHQQTVLQHYQTAAQPFQRFRNMLYSVFNDLGQLGKLGFQFPQQLVVRADLAVQFAAVCLDALQLKAAGLAALMHCGLLVQSQRRVA